MLPLWQFACLQRQSHCTGTGALLLQQKLVEMAAREKLQQFLARSHFLISPADAKSCSCVMSFLSNVSDTTLISLCSCSFLWKFTSTMWSGHLVAFNMWISCMIFSHLLTKSGASSYFTEVSYLMLLPVVTKRFICCDVHRAVPTVYKTVHGSPYPYSFHLKTCNTTWISIAINFSRIHLTVPAPFSWVVLVERWRTHATFLWIKLQMRTLLWSLCATHIMDYRYFVTPNGNYSTEKFGNFSTSKFIFMVCIADQGLSQTNFVKFVNNLEKIQCEIACSLNHVNWTYLPGQI